MRISLVAAAALLFATNTVSAKTYLHETFTGVTSLDKAGWVQSAHKGVEYGKFALSSGKFYGDEKYAQGLKTSEDYRHYAISKELASKFDNKGKDLILQFSVKHEQGIDCGGGYLKLVPDMDPKDFNGDTNYNIMFGPDICGSLKRVHVILNYDPKNKADKEEDDKPGDKNKLIRKTINAPSDELTHIYTLILKPDQTYRVLIDNKEEAKGKLLEDWDFLPPAQIPDESATKPDDWDEREKIPDESDVKPDDWDKEPQYIADPEATKPEDWDEETDGAWEAPLITNPEWKGEWAQRTIANPAYKGKWERPLIDNPKYKPDNSIGQYTSKYVGIDIWQVKSGTIFDDILVTDSEKEAEAARKEWETQHDLEKKAKDEADEKDKKAEEERLKKQEEENKKNKKDDDESSGANGDDVEVDNDTSDNTVHDDLEEQTATSHEHKSKKAEVDHDEL
ncbi:hypothetical protein RI367_008189 [Sorochytrium milnesiophthora]